MTLPELANHLRNTLGVRHKLDIQPVHDLLRGIGHPDVPIGDDCAAIPDGDGYLLLAIEGLLSSFVEKEPWFAGYCAVMVNLSDIYSMGGRPIAIVDAIWTNGADRAGPIWDGMTTAATKYAVPIVGGHTNTRNSTGDHLAAAVLGRASTLLTSFDAHPGDDLIAAIDLRGDWFGSYPYWNASTEADGPRLCGDLNLLPEIAEYHLCRAAKDIGMVGIVGTAVMLAECSGVGFSLDVGAIPRPVGVPLEKWLTTFPSYGFLLAVDPSRTQEVCSRFAKRDIAAAVVGTVTDTNLCNLRDETGAEANFWNLNENPFIGFGVGATIRGAR
jgi:AIR synthase-related protein